MPCASSRRAAEQSDWPVAKRDRSCTPGGEPLQTVAKPSASFSTSYGTTNPLDSRRLRRTSRRVPYPLVPQKPYEGTNNTWHARRRSREPPIKNHQVQATLFRANKRFDIGATKSGSPPGAYLRSRLTTNHQSLITNHVTGGHCGRACAGTPPVSVTRRSRARIPRQYFRGNRPMPMMTSWLATKASNGPNA
jgi:hypothetical protein